MKLLGNPIFLRSAIVFICATSAFLLGMLFMRKLRESIYEESEIDFDGSPTLETLPLHVYNTVIQQLKQQKHELQAQSQADLQRARISDTVNQAVLANLSCGVLVFGTNGLVKTCNPAAKQILGFVSATGMGADDIFRGAVISHAIANAPPGRQADKLAAASDGSDTAVNDDSFGPVTLSDEIDVVLHEGSQRREVEAEYETPAGDRRFLTVTISSVRGTDHELVGVVCLISNQSELDRIRREQALQREISAEKALQLRSSLATISGYAQQLAGSSDPMLARQLAADIAQEAAELDRSMGASLGEKRAFGAAAGASSAG